MSPKSVQVMKVKVTDPAHIDFVQNMRLCGYKLVFYRSQDGSYAGPAIDASSACVSIDVIRAVYEKITLLDDKMIVPVPTRII